MKLIALVVLTLVACSKPNDIPTLQTSAAAIANYYKPKAAELQQRMDHVNQRSRDLANPGDRDAAQAAFADATTTLRDMTTLVRTAKDQADGLAKQGKVEELERFVDSEADKLAAAASRIDEDLGTDDAWVADQERAPAAPPTTQR
jgi:hypothetical protein